VLSPILVGSAGHSTAMSVFVSAQGQHHQFLPQVLSIDVQSFTVLPDRVYGGHYAVYELAATVSLPPPRASASVSGSENALAQRQPEKFQQIAVVQKRFSDFQRLHDHIASAYSGTCYTLPALPPKTWLVRRFDVPFLVGRKRRLQHYMNGLLLLPGVAENPDLRAFLVPQYSRGTLHETDEI
jgi:hypothetical protein